MENRKLTIIQNENYVLKEAVVDSDGDTVWEVCDTKNNNTFLIHAFASGMLYIKFFKDCNISNNCSVNARKKFVKSY